MITKVTHLTLFVTNQDNALKFYTEGLGFTVHTDAMFGPDLRWLTICPPEQPDFEIAILKAESPEEKALVGKQGAGKPFFSLATTDCKKDFELLSARGVKFAQEPKVEPWGISAAFQDLEGNMIYMCQQQEQCC